MPCDIFQTNYKKKRNKKALLIHSQCKIEL